MPTELRLETQLLTTMQDTVESSPYSHTLYEQIYRSRVTGTVGSYCIFLSTALYAAEALSANSTNDQESTGISASYTMGGMTLAGAMNETDNMRGVDASDFESYEFNLSFAF